ncbi:MAG TPA: methyltransferase domain-containing protein [Roseiflexaceae bacterium]|nr:methyltransferase domain-containing protein [Roseiflexaceae bacterium]
MPGVGQSIRSTHNFDDIAASTYDESIPAHVMDHLTRRRVALIQRVSQRGMVLDVGCGTGRLLSQLPATAYERHGIDVSLGMIRQARRRDARLHCLQASATSIPYEDGTFDVVFSAAVLHHIAEPRAVAQAIGEMVRVTRAGGTTIIWDHNPLNPYWPIIMRRVPQDIGEERLISRREIGAALRALAPHYRLRIQWRQMTFIPDFAPVWSLPGLALLEAVLEQLPIIRRISGHNVAIVTKLADG